MLWATLYYFLLLAAAWLGIGLWLGRRQQALAGSAESSILAPN
jgi:hypothetical protein